MKTNVLLKTITVAGAVAATLSLSACDMHISFGQDRQGQEQTQEHGPEQEQDSDGAGAPAAEESAPDSDAGQDSTTGTGSTTSSDSTPSNDSATDGTTSNGTTSSGGSTDSSSATSASDSGTSSSGSSSSGSSGTAENDSYSGPRIGEDGVELDYDGNGKIPADVLEDDIVNAYAKQGTTVDDVDCYSDLRIYDRRGSQSCTVTAAGKNHYGTVKITSASQSGISYSLEFPNI